MVVRLSPLCTRYWVIASPGGVEGLIAATAAAPAGTISLLSGILMIDPAFRRFGSIRGLARTRWETYAPLPYSAWAMVQSVSPVFTVYFFAPPGDEAESEAVAVALCDEAPGAVRKARSRLCDGAGIGVSLAKIGLVPLSRSVAHVLVLADVDDASAVDSVTGAA